MTTVDDLARQARGLSIADRVRLAEDLLSTVHEVDPEVEAAWDAEIRRRIAEVDNGTSRLVPAAEVFAEVRRLIE